MEGDQSRERIRSRFTGWAPPWPLLLLPLVASALFRDLWAPDEPRYAEITRAAYLEGHALVLHLCGHLYPDKPPLLFWLSGLFASLIGWTPFALRVVSLLSVAATAGLIARLGKGLFGPGVAQLAPAMFLGTAMLVELGGRLQIDPLLCALTTAALTFALAPPHALRSIRARSIGLGACVGFAMLAKGPVALLLVGLPLVSWRIWAPSPGRPRLSDILLALLLALAPVLIWAGLAAWNEPALAHELFYGQHIGRVSKGTQHPGPPWKHLVRLLPQLLPWTPPIALGLLEALRAWPARRRASRGDGTLGPLRVLLWFVPLFLVFSLIPVKRDLYLLPIYPAACLLGAHWLTTRGTPLPSRWAYRFPVALFGLLSIVVAIAPFAADLEGVDFAPLRVPSIAMGLVLMGGAVLMERALRRNASSAWTRSLATSWLIATLIGWCTIPGVMNPTKSARLLTEQIAARPEKPSAIPCVGVHPESYRFYGHFLGAHPSGIPTVREPFEEHLEREGAEFLGLIRERDWDKLGAESQAPYREILRTRVGSRMVLLLGAKRP